MAETKELTIKNRLGLHARAAALFVQAANQFNSEVHIEKDGHRVNGKSIMGVMMLAAAKGSVIKVEADGADASMVLEHLEKLVDDKFGED